MKNILEDVNKETIIDFRTKQKANQPNQSTLFLEKPAQHYAKLIEAINNKEFGNALLHFKNYFEQMRDLHDLSSEYVSIYVGMIQEKINQQIASRVMQQALESCAFVSGIWEVVKFLKPDELAALLAEHLRCHYSGTKREGSVEIIEDKEKYRLIFDPCGTGQALRQRNVKGLKKFPEASSETWNRTNTQNVFLALQCEGSRN
jgi:hypothetical protein